MKRLALLIALLMVLSSTDGCSNQVEDANAVGTETAAGEPVTDAYHYTGEVIMSLSDEVELNSSYSNINVVGGRLIGVRLDYLSNDDDRLVYETALYDFTSGEAVIIGNTFETYYINTNEGQFISAWTTDEPGNLYIVYSGQANHFLRVIDSGGEVIEKQLPLEGLEGMVQNVNVYNGKIYIGSSNKLFAFAVDGSLSDAGVIPLTDDYPHIVSDFKGGLYLTSNRFPQNTATLRKYDLNKDELVFQIDLPYSYLNAVNYNASSDKIYIATNTGIIIINTSGENNIHEEVSFEAEVPYIIDMPNTGGYMLDSMASDTSGNIFITLTANLESLVYKLFKVPGEREKKLTDTELTITSIYAQPFIEEAISRYGISHPNVKFTWDVQYPTAEEGRNAILQGRGEATEKIFVKLMANDVGDIVAVGGMNFDVYNLFKTDVFIDLNEYIINDTSYPDLNKSALNGTMIDNQIKGLPLSLAFDLFFNNLTLLDRLGINLDYSKPLKWSEAIQYALNNPVEDNEVFFALRIESILLYIVGANAPDLMSIEEKSINLRQDWFIELIDMVKELNKVPNAIITDRNIETILTNSAFSILSGTSDLATVFYPLDEYGVYPMFNGEVNNNKILYPRVMLSISANSTQKQEAWDFLSFMLEADQQAMRSLSGAPVNIQGMEQSLLLRDLPNDAKEQARAFTSNIDYTYDIFGYRDDISMPIMQYINDELTLDEALTLAEENVMFRLYE
jgi:ABC-type glycerol-3-phosphate transport system substrate-binding protein